MPDLLQEAMLAKQSGDITRAKQLISQALVQNPSYEAAWMMMSEVVEDVRLKRNCLERVLAINPHNATASAALSKLNTSPLSPVSRGERDKPSSPPKLEKAPPFTPPFTWEGQEEQYIALGDMTYPELSAEKPAELDEAPPTFDWANDSPEPDKTIQKIFDAVSNPEQASAPLQDTDLKWMEDKEEEQLTPPSFYSEDENAAVYTEEPLGSTEEDPYLEPRSTNPEDFSVSAEPQLGLSAFTSTDLALESVSSDYRMWDNAKANQDRIVILNYEELVIANPKESDVPHIVGLFNEHKMLQNLLGENKKTIKLNTVKRLQAIPHKRGLTVEYLDERQKLSKYKLSFSSPENRDEVLDALKFRLGAGFKQTVQTFSLGDKIVPPVVMMLLIAFIGWVLIAGLPMLGTLDPTQLGAVLGIIDTLNSLVTQIGAGNILLVTAGLVLLCFIWLLNNLRQPTKIIVVHR